MQQGDGQRSEPCRSLRSRDPIFVLRRMAALHVGRTRTAAYLRKSFRCVIDNNSNGYAYHQSKIHADGRTRGLFHRRGSNLRKLQGNEPARISERRSLSLPAPAPHVTRIRSARRCLSFPARVWCRRKAVLWRRFALATSSGSRRWSNTGMVPRQVRR